MPLLDIFGSEIILFEFNAGFFQSSIFSTTNYAGVRAISDGNALCLRCLLLERNRRLESEIPVF